MRPKALLLAVAAGALLVPVATQAAPYAVLPAAGQQADARAEAERLAAILLPETAFSALVGPMFDAMLESRLSAEPILRKFFAERPQAFAAFRQKAVPAIQAILGESLPAWRAELRDALMGKLNAGEARSLADFLSSSAGQKLYGGAMAYAANHPDVTEADDRMMTELMATMTPADLAELDRFSALPVAAKFGEISGSINPMLARWSQDIIREQGPRLKQIVEDAMRPYLAPARKTT